MNDEQWVRMLDSLELKFELKKEKETFETQDDLGHVMKNDVERVEFSTDDGDFKVERTTRPLILDKKVHYSHSSAGKGKTEYILSDTEKSHKVTLYKWDDDDRDWREISLQEGFKL
jgi:hypothetical protein